MEVRGGDDPGEGHSSHAPAIDDQAGAGAADRVAAAVSELYAADADAFTDRRKALAAAARAAGDKSATVAIAALRKPTRAAWLVNRLARDDPSAPPRLAAIAAALRAAERAKDGRRLRELSEERGTLIDAFTVQALETAGFSDPPPNLRAEVSATLTAALADPTVAAAFAAGTLTRAEHWSGFGPAADWPDSPLVTASRTGTPDPGTPLSGSGSSPRREPAVPDGPKRQARGAAPTARSREAAERAAGRLENYRDAERTVASAATAAAEAIAAEELLEVEVRDLEQRLIRTRADLASARLHARRAEAAQRRAQQALERLPRD